MTRVLGIDPGYRNSGWAVIEIKRRRATLLDYGLIKTKGPAEEALGQIYDPLQAVLEKYRPTHMALESIFFGRNVSSAVKVGEARGVMLLLAGMHGISEVGNYTPQQAKKLVSGDGRADKLVVQQSIAGQLRLDEAISNEHMADACAIALCHAHQLQLMTVEA